MTYKRINDHNNGNKMKIVKIPDDDRPILVGDLVKCEHGSLGIVIKKDQWWIHVMSVSDGSEYVVAIDHDSFIEEGGHKPDPDLQRQYNLLRAFQRLKDQKKVIDMSIDTSHKDKWIQTFKDIEGQCSKPLPIWDHHAIKWRATLKPSEITSFIKIAKEHQKRYPKRWYHKIGHFLSFTKSTQSDTLFTPTSKQRR